MTPKSRDFHEILPFLESYQKASRTLLGRVGRILECLWGSWNDFRMPLRNRKTCENFEIFRENFEIPNFLNFLSTKMLKDFSPSKISRFFRHQNFEIFSPPKISKLFRHQNFRFFFHPQNFRGFFATKKLKKISPSRITVFSRGAAPGPGRRPSPVESLYFLGALGGGGGVQKIF